MGGRLQYTEWNQNTNRFENTAQKTDAIFNALNNKGGDTLDSMELMNGELFPGVRFTKGAVDTLGGVDNTLSKQEFLGFLMYADKLDGVHDGEIDAKLAQQAINDATDPRVQDTESGSPNNWSGEDGFYLIVNQPVNTVAEQVYGKNPELDQVTQHLESSGPTNPNWDSSKINTLIEEQNTLIKAIQEAQQAGNMEEVANLSAKLAQVQEGLNAQQQQPMGTNQVDGDLDQPLVNGQPFNQEAALTPLEQATENYNQALGKYAKTVQQSGPDSPAAQAAEAALKQAEQSLAEATQTVGQPPSSAGSGNALQSMSQASETSTAPTAAPTQAQEGGSTQTARTEGSGGGANPIMQFLGPIVSGIMNLLPKEAQPIAKGIMGLLGPLLTGQKVEAPQFAQAALQVGSSFLDTNGENSEISPLIQAGAQLLGPLLNGNNSSQSA